MNTIFRSLCFLSLVAAHFLASAVAAPSIINHQGRITVDGTNLNGPGHFKFALIDGISRSHWSNDNSSTNGSEPLTSILIQVANGHYAVGLGDTSVSSMVALPNNIFHENNDLKLRIWFSELGTNGSFELLTPDRKLSSVPYALSADIPDGSIGISQLDNSEALPGKILATTGSGIEWLDYPLNKAGNVSRYGIGIVDPQATLHLGAGSIATISSPLLLENETILCTASSSISSIVYLVTKDNTGQHSLYTISQSGNNFEYFRAIIPELAGTSKIIATFDQIFAISEEEGKIIIFDNTNRTNPQVIGSISDPRLIGMIGLVAISFRDTLHVATSTTESIITLDISDPSTPQVVHHLTHPEISSLTAILHVGNFIYTSSLGKVNIIDISDKHSPTLLETYSDPINIGQIHHMAMLRSGSPSEPILILNGGDNRLVIVKSPLGSPVHGDVYLLPANVLDFYSSNILRIKDRLTLNVALTNGTQMALNFPTPESGYVVSSDSVADLTTTPYTHGVTKSSSATFFSSTHVARSALHSPNNEALIVAGKSDFEDDASFASEVNFDSAITLSGGIRDANDSLGSSGHILTSTGTGTEWTLMNLALTDSFLSLNGLPPVDLSEKFLTKDEDNTFTGATMTFDSTSTVQLNGNAQIGGDFDNDDDSLYFDFANSQSLTWDDSLDQFTFSNDLAISGKIRAGGSGATANTPYNYIASSPPAPSSGDITNSGDLYIDRDLEVQQTIYVGNSVQQLSDRNAKEQFTPVDTKDILEKVASLPITSWQYKPRGELPDNEQKESSVRHIGPVAQDFYAAFQIGLNERTIATVDADGIALAAIQALKTENDTLKKQNAAILKRLEALESAQ